MKQNKLFQDCLNNINPIIRDQVRKNMCMTKEEFKKRWDSDENGGGITFDDIADCAKYWGICPSPKIHDINKITELVVNAAGCVY